MDRALYLLNFKRCIEGEATSNVGDVLSLVGNDGHCFNSRYQIGCYQQKIEYPTPFNEKPIVVWEFDRKYFRQIARWSDVPAENTVRARSVARSKQLTFQAFWRFLSRFVSSCLQLSSGKLSSNGKMLSTMEVRSFFWSKLSPIHVLNKLGPSVVFCVKRGLR